MFTHIVDRPKTESSLNRTLRGLESPRRPTSNPSIPNTPALDSTNGTTTGETLIIQTLCLTRGQPVFSRFAIEFV